MKINKDLSTVEHSMTKIIQDNTPLIRECTTKAELVQCLTDIFKTNNLDTKASRRLLLNVAKSRDFEAALSTVYSSYLFGSNMGSNI